MMRKSVRRTHSLWLVLVAGLAYLLASGCPKAADTRDTNAPALYVLAPDSQAARLAHLLPPEAALRAAAAEIAARGLHVAYVPVPQLGALGPTAYPRLVLRCEADGAGWAAALEVSAKKSRELGRLTFEMDSWDALVSSSAKASGVLVTALERELKTGARPAARELAAEDRASLDSAFADICNDGPEAALPAAALVDKVLTGNPLSAEARCAAAWPSAMLASPDLHGHMQLRGRFLAVPLGWWLAARNASEAGDARTRLTEAWVALACGFPKATLAIVDKLDKEAASLPLAEALRMFATRDYRPLLPDAAGAPAIKQLAWVWALRQCGLFSQYDEAIYKIMDSRKSAAFGPLSGSFGVGTGHMFTEAMAGGATYRFINTVAGMDAAPAGPRRVLKTVLQALPASAEVAADKPQLWEGARVADCVKLLSRARTLAQACPDGPTTRQDGKTAWQSLSPWAYAEAQSGLAYHALYLRGFFVSRKWSVPEVATAFLDDVVEGLEKDQSAAAFFQVIAFTARGGLVSGDTLYTLYGEELGIQPATWGRLPEWADKDYTNQVRMSAGVVYRPCGAWEAQSCWKGYNIAKMADKGRSLYKRAVDNDDYSPIRSYALTCEDATPDEVRAIVAKMPYYTDIAKTFADEAAAAKQTELAIELYEACIAGAPDLIGGYWSLSDLYLAQGDRERAIEVLKEGCQSSQFSVWTGNAMSRLAGLLLDSGKIDEALEWAQRGAQTYSGMGLEVYGRALIAAGRAEEGLESYRQSAERYGSGAWPYLIQMSICKKPAERVVSEAKRLAAMYPHSETVNRIASALAMHGQTGAARGISGGEFAYGDIVAHARFLGLCALLENNPAEAASRYRIAFIDRPYRAPDEEPYSLQQAYIAACLAGDESLKKEAAARLCAYTGGDAGILLMGAYLKGERTREDAFRRSGENYYQHLNMCWLMGAECEAAGDGAKALDYYRHVASYPHADWVFAGAGVRQRIKALEAQGAGGAGPKVESTDALGEAGSQHLH